MNSMIRIAKTENGLVRGLPAADPLITSFKGIPFAAPPVGENRWRAPQAAENWEGVRDCYAFAPIAMQNPLTGDPRNPYNKEFYVDTEVPMSEDCLYLNVWTPADSTEEKLPVLVWIYGGGLLCGFTAEKEFDGERIARRGCVVVTIAYRVNVFGYLAHPEITAESPEAPANFGALDQIAALRWVKRNIAAFGGDPENVTVGGQSMGGYSVAALVASPLCRGLFQKAFLQSGYWQNCYTPQSFGVAPLADAEKSGVEFFELLGVKTLAEARTLDPAFIRDKAMFFRPLAGGIVTDMKFLYDDVNAILERGEGLQIPILLGNTIPEFRDYPTVHREFPTEPPYIRPAAAGMAELEQSAQMSFGDEAGAFLKMLQSHGGTAEELVRYADIQSTELAAHVLSRCSETLDGAYRLYYYKFNSTMPGDRMGAFHSSDLWFFFETLAKCWRPFRGEHYDLARQMCNYLANFIRSGDPNGADDDGTPMPTWTPLTTATPNAMFFDEKGPHMETDGPGDVIDFAADFHLRHTEN